MLNEVSYRAIEVSDAEFVYNLVTIPENQFMIPRFMVGCSLHRIRHFIAGEHLDSNNTKWLILMNGENKVGIGSIHDYYPLHRRASVYWILDWTVGYSQDSLKHFATALINQCFQDLGLHRIQMQCYEFETGLKEMFIACGAVEEAILFNDVFIYGKSWKKYIYSILFPEWSKTIYIPIIK